MKKTIVATLVCLLLFGGIGAAVYFTVFSPKAHTHEWEETWSLDESYHWHKCKDCKEIKDKDSHSLVGGVCSICNYDDSVEDLKLVVVQTRNGASFTIVKLPDGKIMLIDSGNEGEDNFSEYITIYALLDEGIDTTPIDYFVLTNANSTKIGQINQVPRFFYISNCILPREIEGVEMPAYYQTALEKMDSDNWCTLTNISESGCDVTTTFQSANGITHSYTIDFMLPVAIDDCETKADASTIVTIEYNGKTVMIGSEATALNIDAYCEKYKKQKNVDVLVTSFLEEEAEAITKSESRGGVKYLESIGLDETDYVVISRKPADDGSNELIKFFNNNDVKNVSILDEKNKTQIIKVSASGKISIEESSVDWTLGN